MGTVSTLYGCSLIADTMGWDCAFYLPGAAVLAWVALFFGTVYDSPEAHPRISTVSGGVQNG